MTLDFTGVFFVGFWGFLLLLCYSGVLLGFRGYCGVFRKCGQGFRGADRQWFWGHEMSCQVGGDEFEEIFKSPCVSMIDVVYAECSCELLIISETQNTGPLEDEAL